MKPRLIKGFIRGGISLWLRKDGGNFYDYTLGIEGPEGTATITYPALSDAREAWHRAVAQARQGGTHPRDVLDLSEPFVRNNPREW